jgi:hypothetical protein
VLLHDPEKEPPLSYAPHPIDTSDITLPEDMQRLIERLAEHAHDLWARQRLADGWHYGPHRDDIKKEHPCLVPYAALPASEQRYDRLTAEEMLKAMIALGYGLTKRPGSIRPVEEGTG